MLTEKLEVETKSTTNEIDLEALDDEIASFGKRFEDEE
jgi:hypothetical protein